MAKNCHTCRHLGWHDDDTDGFPGPNSGYGCDKRDAGSEKQERAMLANLARDEYRSRYKRCFESNPLATKEGSVERIAINLVELSEESERNQACAHGSLVDGHAVYCHNSAWPDAPRKCRRTWYTGGEVRDEDCSGFAARVLSLPPAQLPATEFCEVKV